VAIANLGRANDGLIMKQQIMLLQSHEPGSTFKLVDLIILEDVADTSTMILMGGR
jgi:hypothetical protein